MDEISDDLFYDNSKNVEKKKESIFLNEFFALFLMICATFGQNFVIDNQAALEDIMTDELNISNQDFSNLYSFYNWPNMILCIISGFLVDRVLGCRLAVILFTVFMTIGQIIFAFGVYHDKIIIMIIGRFVFGLGGESIYVAIFKYASRWFANSKHLNMAISLLYCVPSMGSVTNMYIMPLVYNRINYHVLLNSPPRICLSVSLLVSDCVSFFSFLSAVLLAIIDKKKHKYSENKTGRDVQDTLKLKDIPNFPKQFWFITILVISYYSVIYPYIGNIKWFYIYKYKLSSYLANICNSLVYTVAAILSPIIGSIIDKVGYNIYWLMFGILATHATHTLIAFSFSNAYLNSALLGVFFAFVSSSMYPAVPLIMSEDRLATAFGILQSAQDFGCAVTLTFYGDIVDSMGYFFLELVLITYLAVCFCTVVLLFLYDSAKDGRLNKSAKSNLKNQIELQSSRKIN